jgi:4-hydroxybenzoate polyprenyltransferase
VTATEWLSHGAHPPPGILLFLCLSFVNGCVLEIGRKTWAPENERTGVETYSSLLGPGRSAWVWAGICVLAWGLLVAIGYLVGALLTVAIPGFIALLVTITAAATFARNPTAKGQKRIDTLAGLWVFVCYCLAGYAPFLAERFSA